MKALAAAVAIAVAAAALPALAIDLQPGDVAAPLPGVTTGLLLHQSGERQGFYARGENVLPDAILHASTTQVRAGHGFEMSGLPAFAYLNVPFGYRHPGGALGTSGGSSGVGDPTLLLAVWPWADRAAGSYLGVGAYFSVPLGAYDAERRFNMGENRYRGALQVGWQQMLSARWLFMAAVDAVWFGANDDYGANHRTLRQDALFNAQAALGYAFSPAYSLSASYFLSDGGEQRENGWHHGNPQRVHRYQVFAAANLPAGRLTLAFARDLKVENGLFERGRVMASFVHRF